MRTVLYLREIVVCFQGNTLRDRQADTQTDRQYSNWIQQDYHTWLQTFQKMSSMRHYWTQFWESWLRHLSVLISWDLTEPIMVNNYATHAYSTARVSTILHLLFTTTPYYFPQVGLLLNQLPAAFRCTQNPCIVQLSPTLPFPTPPYLTPTYPTPPQSHPTHGLHTVWLCPR